MMTAFKGNLLDSDCDYICHQVNCQGRMGSGIAKSIRDKWPIVYDSYRAKYEHAYWDAVSIYGGENASPSKIAELIIGDIQIVAIGDGRSVINMFAQSNYGYDGNRYTSYDAFADCLARIKIEVPKGSKIGFPYKIGCGLGGADWRVIHAMIEAALDEDYDVRIYKLED